MTAPDVAELRALTAELGRLACDLSVDDDRRPVADGRRRVELDPEDVSRGLAQLVLTVVELLRQLMERQAVRRMDSGALSDEQIERLGSTFMQLEDRMTELKHHFRLRDEDLNLDLGPLGRLL